MSKETSIIQDMNKETLTWTKRHQSYNILQWRCEENIVEISIHATLKKNEVSCYKFWVDYNLE